MNNVQMIAETIKGKENPSKKYCSQNVQKQHSDRGHTGFKENITIASLKIAGTRFATIVLLITYKTA